MHHMTHKLKTETDEVWICSGGYHSASHYSMWIVQIFSRGVINLLFLPLFGTLYFFCPACCVWGGWWVVGRKGHMHFLFFWLPAQSILSSKAWDLPPLDRLMLQKSDVIKKQPNAKAMLFTQFCVNVKNRHRIDNRGCTILCLLLTQWGKCAIKNDLWPKTKKPKIPSFVPSLQRLSVFNDWVWSEHWKLFSPNCQHGCYGLTFLI